MIARLEVTLNLPQDREIFYYLLFSKYVSRNKERTKTPKWWLPRVEKEIQLSYIELPNRKIDDSLINPPAPPITREKNPVKVMESNF